MSTEDVSKAREKVEKEFGDIQKNLTAVRSVLHDLTSAGPFDDVYELLDRLESTAKKVRKGGAFGSGAKGHRKALEEYRQLTEQPVEDA
ncbi:MAG: hypothetical protein OEM97_01705 [Acidimicrobiia bacterium]|nr:hypothetical protein [Acidimicrobiia bacterium]